MCYKCLVVCVCVCVCVIFFVFFFVVRHMEVVTFFSVKFYHARKHGDGFMAPIQSLWLKFYWKFKVFTEINVNEQTTKHSSEVSQISNKTKQ